jgi:hypothetical protein
MIGGGGGLEFVLRTILFIILTRTLLTTKNRGMLQITKTFILVIPFLHRKLMLEHKYIWFTLYSIQMSMRTMLPSPTVGLCQEQRVVKLKHTSTTPPALF